MRSHASRHSTRRRWRWFALLLPLVVIVSPAPGQMAAAQAEDPSTGALTRDQAFIRIVHASADLEVIDAYVDGVRAIRHVEAGDYSDLMAVPPGNHRLLVVPEDKGLALAALERPLRQEVSLEPGEAVEIAVIGLAADDSIITKTYPVDRDGLGPGEARVRLINAIPEASSLNVKAEASELLGGSTFAEASDYSLVQPGGYDLQLRAPTAAELLLSRTTNLEDGTAYSMYAIGLMADRSLDLVSVPTPPVERRLLSIYDGGCDEPGRTLLLDLADVSTPEKASTGTVAQPQVITSVAPVGLAMAGVLTTTHSLSIERVTGDNRSVVACGEIGGAPLPDGALAVGIREVDSSGDAGISYVAPDATGAGLVITSFVGEGGAQPDNAAPREVADVALGARSAAIHSGRCERFEAVPLFQLGEVLAPLGPALGAGKVARIDTVSAAIAARLEDLTSSDHVLLVRLDAGRSRPVLACGDILGVRRGDGAIAVALRALGSSRPVGIAYLAPGGAGEFTIASVFMFERPAGSTTLDAGMEPADAAPGGDPMPAPGADTPLAGGQATGGQATGGQAATGAGAGSSPATGDYQTSEDGTASNGAAWPPSTAGATQPLPVIAPADSGPVNQPVAADAAQNTTEPVWSPAGDAVSTPVDWSRDAATTPLPVAAPAVDVPLDVGTVTEPVLAPVLQPGPAPDISPVTNTVPVDVAPVQDTLPVDTSPVTDLVDDLLP